MPHRLEPVADSLSRRFQQQRPLRAGSLLVTMYGDGIAPRGGAVTLGSLIRLAEPFGLTDRLVRTSVGRLATDDWLVNARAGRLSEYALSATGRTRFVAATRRIYGETPRSWPGRWTLAIPTGLRGPQRRALRETLLRDGWGEPAPGVYAHPTERAAQARERFAAPGLRCAAIVVETDASVGGSDALLVAGGWDLGDLAARYQRFVRTFQPVLAALGRPGAPPPRAAYVVRTLLVHEYRRIHLRDPLLPEPLLPRTWVGGEAYQLCREIYARLFAAAEAHLSEIGRRLDGPLPAPDEATWRRFGGLARD